MIINLTKQTILAKKAQTALSFAVRARGMIGRKFDSFDAMVFPRCQAIHTFFMAIPLDIIFLSRENQVMAAYHAVKPWKASLVCRGASQTVELPAGTLQRTGTEKGDILDLNGVLTPEINNRLEQSFNIIQQTSGQTAISAPIGEQKS